jgi:cysteine-S-conjugate beta-lyase
MANAPFLYIVIALRKGCMFDFDSVRERRGTDSAKWHKYAGKDIIPMWVADMDFVSPPAVMAALRERVAHGIFGYGYAPGSLNETVLDHLWRTYQWSVQPDWIVWLPGLVSGLNVACRSVGQPGDGVATTVPVYPPFLSAPIFSQRRLITTRLIQSPEGWQFNFADLDGALTSQTSLFILCNPHNPTGRVFTHTELTQLAQICLRHNLVICSDEIHCDLVLDPGCEHIPMAMLDPEVARQTITLMAPSKTYNIPGLSCAFAVIANDSLRRRFKQTMAGIVAHVNVLGMAATQAAYQKGDAWLTELRDYLRGNRDMVQHAIDQIQGVQMHHVQATYLAWIDATQLNCTKPAQHFEQAGVGLSDGLAFDGNGFLRLNFGCSRTLLSTALKRMVKAASVLPA